VRTFAWAGPPYETDDPVPTDYRNYEIYLHSDYHRVGDSIDGSIGTLEVNYGLLPNTQFSFAILAAFSPPPGPTQYGLGDVEVGLKYRFIPETAGRPQVSIYPSVTFATGNPNNGLGEGHGTFFLPLWAQKSYGPWSIFGGGGLQFDREGSAETSWREGLAVTRDVGATNLGVEVFRATPGGALQPGYTDIGFGMIGQIGAYHALLFTIGRALEPESVHGYAAYEWRLGPRTGGP
jgi:hypothetical protein